MMHALQKEFYGDNVRWFIARVIDGSPPYGLEGRVKIRIVGAHSKSVLDIPQSDLPWAQVLIPGTSFGSSGFGGVAQILPGALVFGIFLDGKQSQLPIVIGSLPKIEYPTSVQADSRDDITTNPFAYDYNQSNNESVDPGSQNYNLDSLSDRQTVAFEFFVNNNFTAAQSAGIVGTLEALTDIDPSYDDGTYYGIAAWKIDSNRFVRLNRFAASFYPSKTVESFDLQLLYVLHELRTTRTMAQGKLLQTDSVYGTRTSTAVVFRNRFLDLSTKSLKSETECRTKATSIYNGVIV